MPIYNSLYDIIVTYFYGNLEPLTSWQELVATEIATLGSCVIAATPIILVLWLAKGLFSLGKRWI